MVQPARRRHGLPMIVIGFLIAASRTSAAVPLSPSPDGHETVPVYVNGRGPFPFILDTGADTGALYQWFIDELRLPTSGTEQAVAGQTGDSRARTYRVKDFSLDGYHLRNASALGFPNRRDDGREAGVLGNDFMDSALVAFDFPCRRIEVRARTASAGRFIGAGPGPVQARRGVDGVLTLPVTVNGFPGEALVDTGSRTSRLTSNLARGGGVDPASPAFEDGPPILGAALKKMVPRTGPIGTVRFAGVEVSRVRADVIDLPALQEDYKGRPAMILGVDLLGRYRLIYDHRRARIWLRASSCAAS